MIDNQNSTALSKFLSKKFKDKGLKQSEILEAIANFNGYSDWNTNKASEIKTLGPNRQGHGWSKESYTHVDNGGVRFSFHKNKQILFVESSFFGYTVNSQYFKMTQKELDKMFLAIKNHSFKLYDSCIGNGWQIQENGLFIFDDNQIITIGLMTLSNIVSQIDKIKLTLETLK